VPASNPFAGGRRPGALQEIYAYGLRNPQRFAWDPANGAMYVADIGQNIVEEVSIATPGANLGWNVWEGSFRYAGREGVDTANPRGDTSVTFPVVEYMHGDPLLQQRAAVTGLHVFRSATIPPLENQVLLADLPSGELLSFYADRPPAGGSAGLHRVLLRQGSGAPTTLLALIRARNAPQGRPPAARADLRLAAAADGRVFLLNKADGMIRALTR
jgi:glucose/arabinose dehydrogenase